MSTSSVGTGRTRSSSSAARAHARARCLDPRSPVRPDDAGSRCPRREREPRHDGLQPNASYSHAARTCVFANRPGWTPAQPRLSSVSHPLEESGSVPPDRRVAASARRASSPSTDMSRHPPSARGAEDKVVVAEDQTRPGRRGRQPTDALRATRRRFAVTRPNVIFQACTPQGAGQGHAPPRPQLFRPRPTWPRRSDGGCCVLHSPIPPRPSGTATSRSDSMPIRTGFRRMRSR